MKNLINNIEVHTNENASGRLALILLFVILIAGFYSYNNENKKLSNNTIKSSDLIASDLLLNQSIYFTNYSNISFNSTVSFWNSTYNQSNMTDYNGSLTSFLFNDPRCDDNNTQFSYETAKIDGQWQNTEVLTCFNKTVRLIPV